MREAPGSSRLLTRRELLRRAGALGVVAATVSTFPGWMRPANAAAIRIVVVGAGLARLTCAYRLKQAGYTAQVMRPRTGSAGAAGRCVGSSPRTRSPSTAASS